MKNPKKVCKINLNISNLLKKRSTFKKKNEIIISLKAKNYKYIQMTNG